MRSLPLLAATTVILTGAWACGDGGTDLSNNPPVAAFTAPTNCTVTTPCTFTDASTDPDGDALTRVWNFGDTQTATESPASHQFANVQTYTVSLTVTDPSGASNSVSHDVVVTSGTPGNVPPTANFSGGPCTVGVACSFSDLSSDSDGSVVGWSWNFGDLTPADPNQNPMHTFGAAGTYTVTLTVTDNAGAASTPATQSITVAPVSQGANCTTSGADVTCELSITQASSVTLTMAGSDCQLSGNNVVILQPYTQNAFFNSCSVLEGTQYTLKDANGAALVVQPGALRIRLHQGTGTPTPGAPAGRVDGTFPNWTINFDDGGTPGAPGEPDFNDVVLTVAAQ